METKLIPVTSIDIAHGLWHVRRYLEPRTQTRLQENMSVSGQRDPILVRPTPHIPGSYQLIAGFRRLNAATHLGWARVLASEVHAGDAEAATLALTAELAATEPQTYLERGWAAVRTQELREKAGLPSAIRPLAVACGVKRSTMDNALRIGKVLPATLVMSVADDLGIPVETIICMPQKPILAIARSEPPYCPLLKAAATAHLGGENASKAVEIAIGDRGDGEASQDGPNGGMDAEGEWLELHQDGLLQMRKPVTVDQLSTGERQRLVRELRRTAREVKAIRPTSVQTVHPLDTTARLLIEWVRKIARSVVQALARLIERLK